MSSDILLVVTYNRCKANAERGKTNKLRTYEMVEEYAQSTSVATYWISSWVDYSDKYEIG